MLIYQKSLKRKFRRFGSCRCDWWRPLTTSTASFVHDELITFTTFIMAGKHKAGPQGANGPSALMDNIKCVTHLLQAFITLSS